MPDILSYGSKEFQDFSEAISWFGPVGNIRAYHALWKCVWWMDDQWWETYHLFRKGGAINATL